MCCEKKFTSTRCYGLHLYKCHIHPLPPPKLSTLASKMVQSKQHSPGTAMHHEEVSESESCSSFPEAIEDGYLNKEKSPTKSLNLGSNKSSPNVKKRDIKRSSLGVVNCTPSSSSDVIALNSKSLSAQSKAKRRPLSIYNDFTVSQIEKLLKRFSSYYHLKVLHLDRVRSVSKYVVWETFHQRMMVNYRFDQILQQVIE